MQTAGMVPCMDGKDGHAADGLDLARLGAEEFPDLARLAGTVYYGAPPSDAEVTRAGRLLDLDRSLGVRERGELVATAATCHVELTVPGGRQLPAAGLTEVAVLPTHRHRGLMRRMVAAHLDDARARGEVASVLMATEGAIYGRLGYGVGTLRADWELARVGAALHGGPAPGHTRLVASEEAARVLPRVFDAHRRAQPRGEVGGGGEHLHVGPVSAMMHSAARLPTPVMVSRRSRARANGAMTRSTSWSSRSWSAAPAPTSPSRWRPPPRRRATPPRPDPGTAS